MTTTPRGAPELASAQAVPESTVNEQIRHTEAGAGHFLVADNDLTAPPGTCADGASYIIAATATGAWAGKENYVATAMGTNAASGWAYHAPKEGYTAYIQDENARHLCNGTTWALDTSGGGGNPTECIIIACSDESTAITAGTAKVTFRMPYAFTLSAVRASVTTAPTGSTIVIDINEGGASILSTKLSIDASEKTSTTAATPAVISDTALADDAEMTVDFDQVGSTIAGAGVKVYLIGSRT